ncbi:AAA family ATPase [Nonomuraea rubra]|uniref:AAA family ATPase n=1 Tax=Nonomuraea rubra TaxID=46180 RepID=UPI00360A46B3
MAIKTRKPTGVVPWPVVLLEGGEKAGKSWAAAELSASEKVGQTYWIDLNEGAADEYGAIPGARYLVVEHDGTWQDIVGQVAEIRQEAARAADAGEPPVVLVIDSMTAEWDLLKDWAANRAKGSRSNQQRLQRDPNAEVQVPMNLWNDATARHRRLMTVLMTFPGIVVMTARGKEVASSTRPAGRSKGRRTTRWRATRTSPSTPPSGSACPASTRPSSSERVRFTRRSARVWTSRSRCRTSRWNASSSTPSSVIRPRRTSAT